MGISDWNFLNTLPTANISPFMFTCTPLALILPKNIRKYFLTLISLLSVGMLLSTSLNCINLAIIQYKFHIHFVLDYIAHIFLSLFGIYVVRSKQVSFTKKECLLSSLIIYFVVVIMIVLNVIYDKSFFGLSLNGKHNIYNNVIVDNSFVSMLIYVFGLTIVLLLGYIYNSFLNKKIKKYKGE